MSSKKGVKKALWDSAGHLSTSPRASVRGKVSTWRGSRMLCVSQQETSSPGEEVFDVEVRGVALKLENGHSSPLMVTTALPDTCPLSRITNTEEIRTR